MIQKIILFSLFLTLSLAQNTHHKILKCISTGNWAPFNVRSETGLQGIAVDYWKLVQKKAGLKSYYKIVDDFGDVLNAIKTKKADITISTTKTEDRAKYAVFSKPYITFPFVIATRNNVGFIENVGLLKDKTIAVGKNYTAEKILRKYYPHIKIIQAHNINEALKMVNEGKAFAVVDILPVLAYNINRYQFTNLKIAGRLPYDFKLMFMLRKDYADLLPKINQAIDAITQQEKDRISQKWIPIVYEQGIPVETFKKFVIITIIVILIFIIWITLHIIHIKQQKKLQLELIKAKEDVERALKAKTEFLANMSHEIRTPLNAMFGFIQLLQEKAIDNETKKYLNIIEKSGQNVLTIINDILNFSKLESQKVKLEIIEFNPKEEIEVIYNLFRNYALQKNIFLEIEETNLKYTIYSDPVRLKQIISNLLSNAIKFTPSHKTITLKVIYNDKKESLFISVKDEGIGIEKDKLDIIFESFTQADTSTTRKYGGTGLGLTISYKLVKLLGGEIKVESEVNKGSKFYFSIPAKKGKPIIQKPKTQLKTKDKKYNYHILLVEDNKANQLFMKSLLQNLGVSFDIANDGIEAINKVKNNKYDLIFMDINMPNLDGIEATKKILAYEKENNIPHTPIIALTANALEEDKEMFLSIGMDFYLPKPIDLEKLKDILNKQNSLV